MLKGRAGRVTALLGIVFMLVAVWFLGRSLITGVREAGGLENLLHFDVLLFIAASFFMAVHLTLAGFTWDFVTRTTGAHLGLKKGFSIHFLSQVGKYVPGKIWALMGKYSLSRKCGLTPAQTGQGLLLETVFIVLGSLMTFIPLIPMVAGDIGLGVGTGMIIAAGLAVLLLGSVHPAVFSRLTRLVARVMKSDYNQRKCSFSEMLRLLPVYAVLFLALGAAYWFLCLSFGLKIPFFPGVFIYPAAMGIGYIVIFAPGGFGARELTTVWLVHLAVPGCEQGLAELTALVAWVWLILAEAVAFGISFPLYGIKPSTLKSVFMSNDSPDRDSIERDKG
jgi:uncharacterized membrane protein YbhN (UPF0104 family)